MFQMNALFIIRGLRITVHAAAYTVMHKPLMMNGASFETCRVKF